jgi:hypothetical protein
MDTPPRIRAARDPGYGLERVKKADGVTSNG